MEETFTETVAVLSLFEIVIIKQLMLYSFTAGFFFLNSLDLWKFCSKALFLTIFFLEEVLLDFL